jgi:hypothetical protein
VDGYTTSNVLDHRARAVQDMFSVALEDAKITCNPLIYVCRCWRLGCPSDCVLKDYITYVSNVSYPLFFTCIWAPWILEVGVHACLSERNMDPNYYLSHKRATVYRRRCYLLLLPNDGGVMGKIRATDHNIFTIASITREFHIR